MRLNNPLLKIICKSTIMKILALLFVVLAVCQARRMSHNFGSIAGIPISQFSSLAQGDVGGFIKKAALSRATGGLSDRLGFDSLMGSSGSSSGAFGGLGNLLGGGNQAQSSGLGGLGSLGSLFGGQQQQPQPQQGGGLLGSLGNLGNLGNVGNLASGLFGGNGNHLKQQEDA
jgi:hypothetical protein